MTPEDLRYTAEHEWVRAVGSDGGGTVVRVGLTDFAQRELGDIVFVQLPAVGTAVTGGEPLGDVESTKAVAEVNAPVTGTVTARNDAVEDQPELVNSDPYGEGWFVEIRPDDPAALGSLLDVAAYRDLLSA